MNGIRPLLRSRYTWRILLVLLLAFAACTAIWRWSDAQTEHLEKKIGAPGPSID
ncbi:hypothetical protein [Flaviaesturariibacter amylovorans]|uniref:hypothetical protein n=1 Tax=Flaviaesturariibacter amylovorans TaxID=1084520 RepID=UPI0031F0F988